MHEMSIALSIVEGATEEALRHDCNGGSRVSAVRLQLGALSGVVKEALLFSYDLACAGTILAGSSLDIEEIPATAFCRKCDAERTLASIQDFSCPVCHMPTAEVLRGRELLITGLELEEEYAAASG